MIYRYLYYKLFKLAIWMDNLFHLKDNLPEWSSLGFISLAVYFNLMTLTFFILLSLSSTYVIIKTPLIVCLFAIGIINYFMFIYKGRYMKIVKEFESESDLQRKKSGRLAAMYLIISIILFLIVGTTQGRRIMKEKQQNISTQIENNIEI